MNCKECSKEIPLTRRCKRGPTKYCSLKCNNIVRERNHRERSRIWIDSLKSKPCLDCGKSFPPYCMDFDHRDGKTKEFNVGTARSLSLKRRELEVAKCDIVCACCHRTRTHIRNQKC